MTTIGKLILTAISLVALIIPSAVFAFIDEGPVLWTSGGNVVERAYSDVTNSFSSVTTPIPGVDAKFMRIVPSPSKKEFILALQDSGGTLRVYHSVDAVTWVFDWSGTVGDSNVARFDVAYEQTSGNAMVAYRNTATNNNFRYRYWSASSWGAVKNQTTTYSPNSLVAALRLAPRSGSNQLGIVWLSDNRAGSAGFWNGTTWSMLSTAITTNGTVYNNFAGIYPPMRSADITFEKNSGDMIAAIGQNDASHVRYVVRSSSAGTWSAVSNISGLSGFGDYLRLEPSPTTDEIAYSSCMMEPSIPQYLCDFTMWTGSAWGSVTTDTSTGPTVDGEIPTDVFWVNDSASGNRATVAVYGGASGSGIFSAFSLNGGNFTIQPASMSTPTINGHTGLISAFALTGYPGQAVVAIADEFNNVFLKRLAFSGTTATWSSTTGSGSAEVTQGSNLITSSSFGRLGIALQKTPSLLTIATTTATGLIYIGAGNSGFIDNATCVSASDCAGFTLSTRGTSDVTVSRIMLTQVGNASLANTSAWQMHQDSNGNPNDGTTSFVTGTVSGNTITFNFATPITVLHGQSVNLFVKGTFGNAGLYPDAGQTISLTVASTADVTSASAPTNDIRIAGSPTVSAMIIPVLTGYTNNTESSLNGVNCPNCGGRIFSGASSQSFTITGRGFGNDPGALNRGSALTNVQVVGGTTNIIPPANITSWSSTAINFKLDGAVASDTDADFGLNYGGASGLQVYSAGLQSNSHGFNLFPALASITSPVGLGPMGAKVYSSADTDGVITLVGTRFGSSQGSSTVSILANGAIVESWSNTSVRARVPASIPDTTYSGSVSLTADSASGASAATRTSSLPGFNMRPRLLSITPTTGDPGTNIVITGRHLCPPGTGCPTGTVGTIDGDLVNTPAFSSSSNVVVGGAASSYWGGWNDTTVTTRVASTSAAGTTTAALTAGGWNAGNTTFVVTVPISQIDITKLRQYSNGGLSPVLAVGSFASATTMYFGGIVGGVGGGSNNWSRVAVEVEPLGTAFQCTGAVYCGSANHIVGNWKIGTGPYDCNDVAQNCAVPVAVNETSYHWQARTEFVYNGVTWYYGNWVSFPDPTPNSESIADFVITRTLPVISNLTAGNIDVFSARISWNTDKNADSLIQINTTGTFTNDCAASNGCAGQDATLVLSHSSNMSGLLALTTYYYRIKSCDIAGNCAWSGVQQFQTLASARPAKTIFYHVMTYGGTLTPNASTTSIFNVTIPETGMAFESVFVDMRGSASTVGVPPQATVSVNGAGATYTLPGTATITPWRFYHKLTSLNLTPSSNSIKITAGTDTTLQGLSADVIITYRYNP